MWDKSSIGMVGKLDRGVGTGAVHKSNNSEEESEITLTIKAVSWQ